MAPRHGRRWYDYGLDLGMDWGPFNTLSVSYGDLDRLIWLNLCDRAYGCDVALWDDLSGQGLVCPDIVVSVVLGDGLWDRCDHFAFEYRSCNRDWGRVWPVIGPNWTSFQRNGAAFGRFDNRRSNEWNRSSDVQDRRGRDVQFRDQGGRGGRQTGSWNQGDGRQRQDTRDRGVRDQGGRGGRSGTEHPESDARPGPAKPPRPRAARLRRPRSGRRQKR